MKQKLLYLLFSTLISSFLGAQCLQVAPWTYDVESASTTTNSTMPACWTSNPSGTTSAFRWDIDGAGSTPSAGTGPSGANSGVKYFYTESSSGATGAVAELNTPFVDISVLTAPALSFYSHMFGATMGELHVDVYNGTTLTWTNDVLVLIGQQQTSETNPWDWQIVDLSAFATADSIQVKFRGIRGTSFTSDMCLDDISFVNGPACYPASGLSATVPAYNTVNLSWTGTSSAYYYEVQPNGVAAGTLPAVASGSTTTASAIASGLSGATTYTFYVKGICGTDTSNWSSGYSFTTPCAPYVPTFIQDFSTWNSAATLPICWEEYDNVTPANYSTSSPSTNGAWTNDAFGNDATSPFSVTTTSGSARIELWTIGANDLIVSPDIDLTSGGPYQLDFNWTMTFWSSTAAAQISDDDFVALLVTSDGGLTWTELTRWDSSTVITPTLTGQYHVEDLTTYGGQTVKFAFWGNEGTINDASDVNFYFDNFRVRSIPTCPEPFNLTTTFLTSSSATLAWTNGGSETQWLVEYGPAGFALGSGTTATVTSNPTTVNGLMPQTAYDFYVRAYCNAGDTSDFSFSASATTLCTPVTVPYLYDVESASTTTNSSIADCWSSSPTGTTAQYRWDVDGAGSTPSTLTGPSGAHSGSKYFYTEASSGTTGDSAFLYTPLIDLSTASYPRISFWYHMFGQTMGDLALQINDGSGWQTLQIISGEQQTDYSDPWLQSQVQLFSFVGDTVLIRFAGIRGSNFYSDMSLDDILIEETPLNDLGISSIVSPATGCGNPFHLITVDVINDGALPQYNVPVSAVVSGMVSGTYTNTIDSILPGETISFVIDTIDTEAGGIISTLAYTSLVGDSNNSNDTMSLGGQSIEGLPQAIASVPNQTICEGDTAVFYNTSAASVRWYTAANDSAFSTEDTLVLSPNATTQYAVEVFNKTSETFGPPSSSAPTTGYTPPNTYYGERFIAYEDFTLQSVTVFPNGTGNIELQLYDDTEDTLVAGFTVYVTDGGTPYSPFVVNLNYPIPASANTYRLVYVSGLGVTNLGRNYTGAFPYSTSNGEVVITQSSTSATGGSSTTIYYFYDWVVELNSCSSTKTYFDVVVNQTIVDTVYPVVCNGLTINGNYEDTSGVFIDSLTSTVTGCDSVVVNYLTVNYPSSGTVTDVFCSNSPYILADGTSVSVGGTYTAVTTNSGGCDSTITYTLSTLAVPTTSQSVLICAGDSFVIGGNVHTVAGIYTDTLTAANGCDSLVTTDLSVNSLPTVSVSGLPAVIQECAQIVTLTLSPEGGELTGVGVISNYYDPHTAGIGMHTVTYEYTNDTTGCSAMVNYDIEVTVCTAIDGISGIETFTLYPNPYVNNVTLSFNDKIADILGVKLYDVKGGLLLSKEVITHVGDNTINLKMDEFISTGVVILELSRNGAYQTVQLIQK